jgi:hypothetical protein
MDWKKFFRDYQRYYLAGELIHHDRDLCKALVLRIKELEKEYKNRDANVHNGSDFAIRLTEETKIKGKILELRDMLEALECEKK